MSTKRSGRLGESAGYSVVEALTVVAGMGMVAAFTAPSMLRFQAVQQVQSATAEVGGMLQRVRARAVSEAVPYLVLFQKEEVAGGTRSAFALIVRDADRSYTLTPPDSVETFTLGPDVKPKVRQYGESGSGAFGELTPPATDRSTLVSSTSGSGSSGSGSASSGSGSSGSSGSGSGGLLGGIGGLLGGLLGGSGSSGSGSSATSTPPEPTTSAESAESVGDVATNGTTFPVSDDSGVPSIAFNERGIPVSTDSPNDWGSGAGAVYLTDNENTVYAATVSPLGEVSLARYDARSSSWR